MAKRKKHKKDEERESKPAWHADLHPETKKSVLAILCFVIVVIFVLSYIGKGGTVGNGLYYVLNYLLGKGYFFAPLAFLLVGFSLLFSAERKILIASAIGVVLFIFSSLSLLTILFDPQTGGLLGSLLGSSLLRLFDFWVSVIISASLFIISQLLMFNVPLMWRRTEDQDEDEEEDLAESTSNKVLETLNSSLQSLLERKKEETPSATPSQPEPATSSAAQEEPLIALRKATKKIAYIKPPLDLLQGDRGTPSSGDIKANSNIIKRTLENFGVDVEMGEVSVGPTVTQYTLKPAEGVKLARITGLHNDLSLALAAHPIRIEAPIPGKSLVGIEVPNRSIALVGLRALLENKIYQDSSNPLLFAVGRDVTGAPVFADLAKMPHLLISGATGSGKSVCTHSVITSLLYRNPPEILRFILVDPKRVELSVYNDIPHLLTPVITDPKKTVQALRWATKEMDRRYELLSQSHSRDIISYNSMIAKEKDQDLLPYLVIMVDELADLMTTFPREVESSIIRLAQMARAVGIHLIVATQRPSVEVITGLIKANITSRVAFQVASQIDSRTILDTSGAEKLLGNGDMLFVAGDTAKPRRIQGGFISEQEVKRVVDFLREDVPEYNEGIFETKLEDDAKKSDDLEDDPLYFEAQDLVQQAGKASASYLQRRLKVGYARAARLLDLMEANGVIGPADGAKPREILASTADSRLEEEL